MDWIDIRIFSSISFLILNKTKNKIKNTFNI